MRPGRPSSSGRSAARFTLAANTLRSLCLPQPPKRNQSRAARSCSISRRVGISRVERAILTLGIRILLLPCCQQATPSPSWIGRLYSSLHHF